MGLLIDLSGDYAPPEEDDDDNDEVVSADQNITHQMVRWSWFRYLFSFKN